MFWWGRKDVWVGQFKWAMDEVGEVADGSQPVALEVRKFSVRMSQDAVGNTGHVLEPAENKPEKIADLASATEVSNEEGG